MTGKTPQCSIVIRAYNEEQHIGRLLEGIHRQTDYDFEVILVDSGSTDATVEIARQFGAKVIFIAPKDFTFGRSLNLGIRHATADLIVIASAHVYPVYPDWLEHLLAPFSDPQVALTYGKQRGAPASYFSEQQIFASWFPDHSSLRQEHPFCNNANAAIRRKMWEIRPYDEGLSGLEDLEWANWAVRQGQQIAYVSEAEIVHVHNESPSKVYNRYRREAMAFKRIFPQEQFNLGDFLRLYTSNVTSDLRQAARQKVLWPTLGTILWFRWMQFWGTYQGYRQSGPLTWHLRQTFYYPPDPASSKQTPKRAVEPIRYNEQDH